MSDLPDEGEIDEAALAAAWGLPSKTNGCAARATTLMAIEAVLRQLREIKGVHETSPGRFVYRHTTLLQFVEQGGALNAELKKAGGSGTDRYLLDTPPQQRKLVDDAKRRAAALDDE